MLTKVNFSLNQLISSDLILGYHVSNWNPRVNCFLIGSYRSINLFNAHQVFVCLKKFVSIVSDMLSKKCRFWFVNENFNLFDSSWIMEQFKSIFNEVVVLNNRWLKGTLSNYKKVAVLRFRKFPHAVVVPNLTNNHYVVNEAFLINIPSFSLIDTSDNPLNVFFPVPGNSKSVRSLFFFYYILCKSVLKARILNTSSFLFNFYQKSEVFYNFKKFRNIFETLYQFTVPKPFLFHKSLFIVKSKNYGWLTINNIFKVKKGLKNINSINLMFYVYITYFVNLLSSIFFKQIGHKSSSFFFKSMHLIKQLLKTFL